MMLAEKSVAVRDHFVVTDSSGNLITGLVQGNFTIKLYDPTGVEVSGSVSVTITEIALGNYSVAFTPTTTGSWLLVVTHATYFPWGKRETYLVSDDLFDGLPAAIDVELSGTHGAGDWGTESVGTSALTVTVTDFVTTDAIAGVTVHIRNAAGDVLYDWGVTDENGQVGMLLSDGSYRIWCSKVGSYSFTNPTTVTVSGATAKAITGTPFSPTTPASPDLCTVYGWTLDEQGTAISVTVKAELVADQRFMTDGPQIVKQAVTESSTEVDGYWEIALTRSAEYATAGVTYRFTVDDKFVGEFTVPDQATVGLKELATA